MNHICRTVGPIRGITAQPRLHRVVIYIPPDPKFLIPVPNQPVMITVRPETSDPIQYPIRLDRTLALQTGNPSRQFDVRPHDQMHVIRHDYPIAQFAESSLFTPLEAPDDRLGNPVPRQPAWTSRKPIQQPVHSSKLWTDIGRSCRNSADRHRSGKPPGQEIGLFGKSGMLWFPEILRHTSSVPRTSGNSVSIRHAS